MRFEVDYIRRDTIHLKESNKFLTYLISSEIKLQIYYYTDLCSTREVSSEHDKPAFIRYRN